MCDNPESLQGKTQKPGGPECSHGVTDADPSLPVRLLGPLVSLSRRGWVTMVATADPRAQHPPMADWPAWLTKRASSACPHCFLRVKESGTTLPDKGPRRLSPQHSMSLVNGTVRPSERVCHTHSTYSSISCCTFTAVLSQIKPFVLGLFPETKC